jgi:peptidyl-prolyl cis-trans isomerase A (cyclophilin A)
MAICLVLLLLVVACGQSPRQARREVVEMGYSYSKASFAEALKKGDEAATRLFLAAGMEPDMQVQGYSALGHAAFHTDLLRLLLESGADANVGGGASTPLIEAAGGGNTAGVSLLLEAGADINGLAAGYSPLMAAVEQGEAALVQSLLEAGANVNARSATGHTPLGIALAAEKETLVALLEGAGASRQQVGANMVALMQPERLTGPAPARFAARFETSVGTFVIEVERQKAPVGADRFYHLVRNGFYDGQYFFRVVPGRLVQFGLSGLPSLAARWAEAVLADDPAGQSNGRGTISFAAAGPASRSTQVFINLRDNPQFDRQDLVPFGQVQSGGMAVVEAVYSAYGEAPQAQRLGREGDAYLKKHFPDLDIIERAHLVESSAP